MAIDPWLQRLLLKLAVSWVPAASLLCWLWLRKIRSVILYFASCANLGCYLLWLGTMVTVRSPIFYRWSSESKNLDFVLFVIPAFTFVLWPLFATVGSFILLIASCMAKQGERRFLVPANLLMLILWASSIVAPN
jgi:hypothetical protein